MMGMEGEDWSSSKEIFSFLEDGGGSYQNLEDLAQEMRKVAGSIK